MAQKISRETLLSDIINKKGAREILSKYKVPCLTCPMAQFEIQNLKIGDVCKMYSIDLKELLVDLNKTKK